MVIAVNTRFLLEDHLEGCGYFISETFRLITQQHPEHRFYFLFDRPYSDAFVFSDNVHPLVIGPPARHPLLWKYWYDFRVSRVLKKIKADVFVSPDGYASLRTRVPQCLVVHDLGFLHYPEAYRKLHVRYMKHYTPKFLRQAATIATVSEFSKTDIVRQYRVDTGKIRVVPNAPKESFVVMNEKDRAEVKDRYTDGKEYFLCSGALQPRKNLVNLLKAFSIFKKRQKSGMKLVLAGRLAWKNDAFLDLLKTYKYRDDVVLTGYLPERELAKLTAAAYALAYPSFFEGFGVPVIEAMRCGVPALTSKGTAMEEIGGGLYFDPHDSADIADKLMLIYKDESLRSRLIEKGLEIAARYSWQYAADALWNCIVKAQAKS